MIQYLFCPNCEERALGFKQNGQPFGYLAEELVAFGESNPTDFSVPETLDAQYLEALVRQQSEQELIYSVTFEEQRIGLMLSDNDDGTAVVVKAFTELDGALGPAEACGKISIGDIVMKVGENSVRTLRCADILNMIIASSRPIELSFLKTKSELTSLRVPHVDWNRTKSADNQD